MKIKNYIKNAVAILVLIGLGSCEKFLDVQPKTELRESDLFKTEIGFQDALNGIYINMANTSLYGRELTYGFTDVLGSMYVETKLAGNYVPVFRNEYLNAGTQSFIDGIWLNAYQSIANLNNLIAKLESADKAIFTGNNYNIIKGEALGLRAMLYFDLYRLFGPTKLMGGDDFLSIPYRTVYDSKVVGKSSGKEIMAGILSDLLGAADALKTDPLINLNPGVEAGLARKMRLNYYAVKGLTARYHLWNNEPEKALAAAEEVINSNKFSFTALSSLSADDPNKDRTFIPEQLFALYNANIKEEYAGLLVPPTNIGTGLGLQPDIERLKLQYETTTIGASDRRYLYLIELTSTTVGNLYYFTKLSQPEAATVKFYRRIPLIKLPEMYYIAAECLKVSDPVKAIGYLNTVRTNRTIASLAITLTAAQIQDEIRKEYWKETPLEGQMFFYYKRTNSTSIPGKTGSFNTALYTLPLPLREVELGF